MRKAAWPGFLTHIRSLNNTICGVRLYIHVPFMRLNTWARIRARQHEANNSTSRATNYQAVHHKLKPSSHSIANSAALVPFITLDRKIGCAGPLPKLNLCTVEALLPLPLFAQLSNQLGHTLPCLL